MAALLRVGLLFTLLFLVAVSVYLLYKADVADNSIPATEITWSGNIAPLVYNHCARCHHEGTVAPFSLTTYHDVAKRSLTIRAVIDKHIMPPWPADPSYSHFADENYLSDEEIKMIDSWVEAGAPRGDSTKEMSCPQFFAKGSLLGKPDLTLHIKPFLVHGNSMDQFMVMKIPLELSQDSFIRAIEFVPGSKYVHHVNGHLICFDDGKKKTTLTGDFALNTKDETREDVLKKMELLNDDGSNPRVEFSATNYLPGVIASIYPEGIGGFLVNKKNIIYLNDIHYGPSDEDVWDSSYVNIFLDSLPPKRPVKEFQLGTLGVSKIIPPLIIPSDTVMTFVTRTRITSDISILTVNPHMHLLGKSFIAYAIKPDGDTIPLIRIPQWDFRWQYFYTFKKMLHIPAGSVIEVQAVMDNTSNNPNNPHNPPQTVEGRNGSMKTTDEMLQLIISYLPYENGDENISIER